ncbi:hypothetical protein D9615_010032 [Tricholomella constricta]|uniref:Uncharacterized protein n=1 Tax=Tricholomella constricta TaxID=117010 RepID=A0A8H5GTL9_9AGAR|nr:hypothetical protein D9615_010032 [Tricholomella constricta]
MDTCARDITEPESEAFRQYLENDELCGPDRIPTNWSPSVGQVARSLWKESLKPLDRIRTARRVKLLYNNEVEFGDVRYYFRFDTTNTITRTLAVISLYSRPDYGLLEASSDARLVVVDVKCITAVVAVVPHSTGILGENWEDRVFVVEKPGMDISLMAGVVEQFQEEDA